MYLTYTFIPTSSAITAWLLLFYLTTPHFPDYLKTNPRLRSFWLAGNISPFILKIKDSLKTNEQKT